MDKDCTVYRTVDFISKRWTLLILLELYKKTLRPKRYTDIKNSLPGITPKVLSLRLKDLEKLGLITKKIDTRSFPIRCEYSLTETGKDFINIVKDIKKWALRWKIKNKACGSQDCKNCTL